MNFEFKKASNQNRIEAYKHFKDHFFPFISVTVEVEITKLLSKIKENNLKFSQVFSFIILKACNEIDEFKYRIKDGQIVEYSSVGIGPIALTSNRNIRFLYIPNLDLPEFILEYENQLSLETVIKHDPLSVIYISCVPWFNYTGLITPIKAQDSSIPIITFGKYIKRNKKIFMPLSIQVHHGLIDGYQISLFLSKVNTIQDYIVQKKML